MENLISMTDFVLEQSNFLNKAEYRNFSLGMLDFAINTTKYAKFLKQPLELWMFVPCVDNEVFNYSKHGNKEQYNQAKERCLFEGFKLLEGNNKIFHLQHKKDVLGIGFRNGYYKTVEDIVCAKTKLTESAKKMFI